MRFTVLILVLFGGLAIAQAQSYRHFTLSVGVNAIENNDGEQTPTSSELDFRNPLYVNAEKRISRLFSVSAGTSLNKLELKDDSRRFFVDVEAGVNLFLDRLIWDNIDLEWTVGTGFGFYWLETYDGTVTYNLNSGFRYWFSDQFGVAIKGGAKVGFNDDDVVRNYYQYSLSLVWGILN